MRRLIVLMAVVLVMGFGSVAMADVYWNDGLSHEISTDPSLVDDEWCRLDYDMTDPPLPGTHVDVVDNGHMVFLSAYNNSRITSSGGWLDHFELYDNAGITVRGGNVWEGWLSGNSSFTMSSGKVYSGLNAYNTSSVSITGGENDWLSLNDNTTATISNGRNRAFEITDNATLEITGGLFENFSVSGNSSVNMTSGFVNFGFGARENAKIFMSGGVACMSGDVGVNVTDNAILTFSGGSIGRIEYPSTRLSVSGNGIIYLDGSNFEINGQSLSYGDRLSDFGSGIITGTLSDGTPMENRFNVSGGGSIIIIPEPTTLLLLGLGGLMLRRHRRSCKTQ